jgi:GNAT superfamily N-acetyltransferase
MSEIGTIRLTTLAPEFFAPLAELQRICYPTLAATELMGVEHFASQYQIFPQGQFVALATGDGPARVVGQGSGFFIDFDFDHPQHSFREICAEFYFTNHNPNGAYYYGADISVHPDFRRCGIGRLLYSARQELVKRSNRQGIVAGGLIPGYIHYRGKLSIQEYVDEVVAGQLNDPTLTFQLRNGFRVAGMIENYLEDSASDNWATLIVWDNPEFRTE